MRQLRINGELIGYGRISATSTNLVGMARIFLIAMFVGIILAGVFLAVTADVERLVETSAQLK
jgi:hypothetical protein